jgi:hypothetical protein
MLKTQIVLSDCAPATDGYGPACNRFGEGHLCGLDETPEQGYLVHLIVWLLYGWYGNSQTNASANRHARQLIRTIREYDEEEGDGR